MVAERQDRYPKGTDKVIFACSGGNAAGYCLMNLFTGRCMRSDSIWDLIKSIERDLSENRFPQSAIRYRTWGAGAKPAAPGADRPAGGFGASGLQDTAGPTFIVRVLYRQNATWQGTVQWMEGRQTRPYRSVNELLSLMDDAAGMDVPDEALGS
jgi:hypothetical protein